jgi:hypothetical protein
MEVGSMGGRLFTDKLVFGWSGVLGVWSFDRATPATSAYPAHASGSPHNLTPTPAPSLQGALFCMMRPLEGVGRV